MTYSLTPDLTLEEEGGLLFVPLGTALLSDGSNARVFFPVLLS